MAPYDALAGVYDRWTADAAYDDWASFVDNLVPASGSGRTILDLCCGTGRLSTALADRGFRVVGVDRSDAMLERARASLPDGTVLVRADLPDGLPAIDPYFAEPVDAAVCSFDSVNYFVGAGDLARLFGQVARRLRPAGVFVFDLNTRHKLETVFGSSHYGDDQGDFAYVWRNRQHPAERITEFLITLFTRDGAGWVRSEEHHRQRWFAHEEVRAAAGSAGLSVDSVTADYGSAPATDTTLRETWVLRAGAG